MVNALPDELTSTREQLADVQGRLDRLLDTIEKAGDSPAIHQRLHKLESEKAMLESRQAQLLQVEVATIKMPDDQWIREQLASLADLAKQEMESVAPHLRPILGRVVAEQVFVPGKKRGYARIRFKLNGWAMIAHLLSGQLPASVTGGLVGATASEGPSPDFVIDLARPTRIDQWTSQVMEWRRQKMRWQEIAERTGLSLSGVWKAYERGLKGEHVE